MYQKVLEIKRSTTFSQFLQSYVWRWYVI